MRGRVLVVVVGAALAGIQCSGSTSDDSAGTGGVSGDSGGGGVSGASRGGSGGKGSAGKGGAASGGSAGTSSSNGGRTSQGGQPATPEAGTGGVSEAGASSGSDAGAMGEAGAAGAPSSPEPKPIAHFGQVRFLNLAPGAVPLDFCMKPTTTATYTAGPILQANGAAAGVPFGSQTKYFTLPISFPTAFDFVLVAGAAVTCDPPWLGAFGSVTFNPSSSSSIAVFQTTFPATSNFNGAVLADLGIQAAHTGNVRTFYAANVLSSAIDVHMLRAGAADETWLTNFPPGSAATFHSSTPGTYEFRALKTGTLTLLADKLGAVVAAGDPWDLFLYESGTGAQAFAGCASDPGSAAVSACMH